MWRADRNMAHFHCKIQLYYILELRNGKIMLLLSTVDDIVISMLTRGLYVPSEGSVIR